MSCAELSVSPKTFVLTRIYHFVIRLTRHNRTRPICDWLYGGEGGNGNNFVGAPQYRLVLAMPKSVHFRAWVWGVIGVT